MNGLSTDINQDLQADVCAVSQGACLTPGFHAVEQVDEVIDRCTLQEYLNQVELSYLLPFLLEFGIDALSDLRYLYVEDLVEGGFDLEVATRLLQPFHPHGHRRPEGPFRTGSRSQEVPLIVQGGKLAWVGIRGRRITWTPPAGGAQGVYERPTGHQRAPGVLSRAAPPRSSPAHPCNQAHVHHPVAAASSAPNPVGFSPEPLSNPAPNPVQFSPEPLSNPSPNPVGFSPEPLSNPSPNPVGFSPEPLSNPSPNPVGFSPEPPSNPAPNPVGFSPGPLRPDPLRLPSRSDDASSKSSDHDGTLRNVLLLNGLLVLSFLGRQRIATLAWALTAPTFHAAILDAQVQIPSVSPSPHPLRPLLAVVGPLLIHLLGPEDSAMYSLAQTSGTFRWGVSFAFEDYRGRGPYGSPYTSSESTSSNGSSDESEDESFANVLEDLQAGDSSDDTSLGSPLEAYYADDPIGQVQDNEPSALDISIAQAAFLLYQHNFHFDWEQLTPIQQDIYHGLVGRWLQQVHEVD